MVSAAYNDSMQWFNTVGHGIVSWMTRGIHLGYHRSYLDVQVDDVLLPDSRWSVDGNCTPGDDCVDPAVTTPDIRMTAADVQRLVAWQKANDFRLDMVFNGGQGEFGVCPTEGCPKGTVDLENVATHEAGHFLGLAHSLTEGSTMWKGAEATEIDDLPDPRVGGRVAECRRRLGIPLFEVVRVQ